MHFRHLNFQKRKTFMKFILFILTNIICLKYYMFKFLKPEIFFQYSILLIPAKHIQIIGKQISLGCLTQALDHADC